MRNLILLALLIPSLCFATKWQEDVISIIEYPNGQKHHVGLIIKHMTAHDKLESLDGVVANMMGVVCEYRTMEKQVTLYVEINSETPRYQFSEKGSVKLNLTNEKNQTLILNSEIYSTMTIRSNDVKAFIDFIRASKTVKVYDFVLNVEDYDVDNEVQHCITLTE